MARIVSVTGHAAYRLEVREITITECEQVLNAHHIDVPSKTHKGVRVMYGIVNGRRLKIFVKPLGNDEYELRSTADQDEVD